MVSRSCKVLFKGRQGNSPASRLSSPLWLVWLLVYALELIRSAVVEMKKTESKEPACRGSEQDFIVI